MTGRQLLSNQCAGVQIPVLSCHVMLITVKSLRLRLFLSRVCISKHPNASNTCSRAQNTYTTYLLCSTPVSNASSGRNKRRFNYFQTEKPGFWLEIGESNLVCASASTPTPLAHVPEPRTPTQLTYYVPRRCPTLHLGETIFNYSLIYVLGFWFGNECVGQQPATYTRIVLLQYM